MGWRISLYRLPKQTEDKWKNITEEQYHTECDKLYEDLTSECIYYDTLTDIICEDRDKKLHSDFFINNINTDESAYITISKEQFLDIMWKFVSELLGGLMDARLMMMLTMWNLVTIGRIQHLCTYARTHSSIGPADEDQMLRYND